MKYIAVFISLMSCFSLFHVITFGQENNADPEFYRQLNDSEKRLWEYRDGDNALGLKLNQLAVINASRKKFRAKEVRLDILASRVANKQCREAAEKGFLSHWNTAGEKPYQRYAFAGGYDHIAENAFGQWTSDKDENPGEVADLMKAGHGTFMKEKAPADGHKKNIISKDHNYVGIGYYITAGQFRYYEEFIDRYLDFVNVPAELKTNEAGSITVDTRGESFLYFMTVYREKFPVSMSVQQLSRTGSYEDYSDEVVQNIPAWGLASYRKGTRYTIPVKFTKEGLYYVHLYIDKKENTGSVSVNTKGKEPVSGIVIKVRR